MNFIDSHTHLYREYYPDSFEEVIQRAIDANVTQMLLPCVNRETPDQIQEVVELFPDNLYAMVGLHPSDVREDYLEVLDYLHTRLNDRNVIAVGEIGLDFYYDRDTEKLQKDVFYQQLCWARDLQLPLSLHIRSAYNEALEILQKFKPGELSGILHCFSGGIQEARWAVAHNFAIGVGGIVTFKNSKLPQLVEEIGLKNIVLETDAPYLAPTPHRGKPNESSYIPIIAQKIAEIFQVSVREVMEQTSCNVYRIFKKLPANE